MSLFKTYSCFPFHSYVRESNSISNFLIFILFSLYILVFLSSATHMCPYIQQKTEWNGNKIVVLGCIEPPIPSHVSLVQRTEHVLNFVCDSKYVFPDTAATSRELVCNRERHTWDKTLPNCVGKYK